MWQMLTTKSRPTITDISKWKAESYKLYIEGRGGVGEGSGEEHEGKIHDSSNLALVGISECPSTMNVHMNCH